MKVSILFECNCEDDGWDGEVMVVRDDITDTHSLLTFYTQASSAAGFTYWDRTGYATSKGVETWEKF